MIKRGMVQAFLGGLLVLAVGLSVTQVADADAADVTKKLKKQMRVLESVLDEVLVDSPNFLVHSRDNTHGLYLNGFGALFTFEAALISGDDWFDFSFSNKFKIRREDGKVIIDIQEDDDDDNADKDDEEEDFDEEEWKEKHEQKQAELYEAGKAELIETLMDYGETLTTLGDDEWVAIAAFLRDSDFFVSSKISTLVLKANIGDLRDYSQGNLSEKAMAGKIVEEEY